MAGEDSILLMVGYGGEARALPGVLLHIRKKPAGASKCWHSHGWRR